MQSNVSVFCLPKLLFPHPGSREEHKITAGILAFLIVLIFKVLGIEPRDLG